MKPPTPTSALARAQALQEHAAQVGFDWDDVSGAVAKLHEEIDELAAANDSDQQEEELGDLLFSLVNLARWLGLSADETLQRANDKFVRRFAHVQAACQQQGRRLEDLTLAELDALWEAAKASEE